jgi:hypothetical protein
VRLAAAGIPPHHWCPHVFALRPQKACTWAIDRLRQCCRKMGRDSLHCSFPDNDEQQGAAQEPAPRDQQEAQQQEPRAAGDSNESQPAAGDESEAGLQPSTEEVQEGEKEQGKQLQQARPPDGGGGGVDAQKPSTSQL